MNVEELIASWRKLSLADRQKTSDIICGLLCSEELEKELTSDVSINRSNQATHHEVINDSCLSQLNIEPCHMIMTSPPYNANMPYDFYKDNIELSKYLDFILQAFTNCDRFLLPGGRCVINIRDVYLGNGKRFSMMPFFWNLFVDNLGYSYRGTHIWYKGREESSTAWGSWCSSSNPSIIDLYENIYVFEKNGKKQDGVDDLSKTEFIESILGVWKIRPVKKKFKDGNKCGHPCPFPSELVARTVRLYSHVGDVILDPFAGILSTAIGAASVGRNSCCIELSRNYCELGIKRFNDQYGVFSGSSIKFV